MSTLVLGDQPEIAAWLERRQALAAFYEHEVSRVFDVSVAELTAQVRWPWRRLARPTTYVWSDTCPR